MFPGIREKQWHAAPIGFAAHHGNKPAIDLLVPVSADIWNLAYLGRVDRLREVLRQHPHLAREMSPQDVTPLFWLPADDERAAAVVELLVANGADAAARTPEGRTAEEMARERDLDAAAAKLANAAAMNRRGPDLGESR